MTKVNSEHIIFFVVSTITSQHRCKHKDYLDMVFTIIDTILCNALRGIVGVWSMKILSMTFYFGLTDKGHTDDLSQASFQDHI